MANEQNLIPGGHVFTREEASKGGKNSARKRRLQGAIKKALDSEVSSAEFKELFEQFDIEEDSKDYAMAIACAFVMNAAKGNLSAAGFVRDIIGEKQKDDNDFKECVVIVDDITNPIK